MAIAFLDTRPLGRAPIGAARLQAIAGDQLDHFAVQLFGGFRVAVLAVAFFQAVLIEQQVHVGGHAVLLAQADEQPGLLAVA